KSFRVFSSRTRIVEENLHIRFSESTPNVVGSGPDWLFDIDVLTRTMNYEPIVAGTQSNDYTGIAYYYWVQVTAVEDSRFSECTHTHTLRVDGKEIIITESSIRRDIRLADKERQPKRKKTQVPQTSGSTDHIIDEAVYKKLDDRLVRAATTTSSLEAEQDSGNKAKTQSKETPNEASSPRTTSGDGPRCQEAMGDTIAQTRVLALEKTKITQVLEITSLKKRVKKLEKKQRSRTHKLKRLYKEGKIYDIDADENITLVNDQDDAEMFDVNDLHDEEVFVEKEVADKEVNAAGEVNAASIATTVSSAATITTDEITLAQELVEIKTSKPKAKRVVIQEPCESIITTISLKKSQDKGKAIMIKEPVKPKKKDQIRLDEEAALKLQAELQTEFEEEQRLAIENTQKEQEVNIALIEK
nr:ribonuclease H-like domain-containing protein [Tanacetum cinerariifolium]